MLNVLTEVQFKLKPISDTAPAACKMTLAIKVVKINSKIISLLPSSNGETVLSMMSI
jgi:hypothetical protein